MLDINFIAVDSKGQTSNFSNCIVQSTSTHKKEYVCLP